MPANGENAQATKTSHLEMPRPIRLKALAAKLRQQKPNDPKALKLASNLEAGARWGSR